MDIVIKKKYLAKKNKIVGDGSRTHDRLIRSPKRLPLGHNGNEFLGFQIKYKYKRRVDEGAKWYPVRVLLI